MSVRKTGTAALLLLIPVMSCAPDKTAPWQEPRFTETILDKRAHIEPELVLEVPDAPRWCGRLDLKTHRIDVEEGKCSLYVEEEGRGTPLVLINGGPGGTHHYFHPWFSRARRWARVIYYDQRGTGLSDYVPGEKGYSVEQAVGDLDEVRKALNIDRWVVLGYSYGGFLAQYYAIHHPEHTAGMVLLNASPGMSVGRGDRRIDDFLTAEERIRQRKVREEVTRLAKERDWDGEKSLRILLYNHNLNGGWKFQHFHKPTPERAVQMARYEWVHDSGFNGLVGTTLARIDLEGAFEGCPIPTLICEGAWDMTWNQEKAEIIRKNHPGAELVMFAQSAHQLFEDEPDKFFGTLKEFLAGLRPPPPSEMEAFSQKAKAWLDALETSPDYVLAAFGWSRGSSKKLAGEYSREWLEGLLPRMKSTDFLKVGFALYDTERYEDALSVFTHMAAQAADQGNDEVLAAAQIWQGHMLDLMGQRERAKAFYAEAAAMELDAQWSHGQYGMKYRLSPYAKERLRSPFRRIENRILD